jgi:hypothetical protein
VSPNGSPCCVIQVELLLAQRGLGQFPSVRYSYYQYLDYASATGKYNLPAAGIDCTADFVAVSTRVLPCCTFMQTAGNFVLYVLLCSPPPFPFLFLPRLHGSHAEISCFIRFPSTYFRNSHLYLLLLDILFQLLVKNSH